MINQDQIYKHKYSLIILILLFFIVSYYLALHKNLNITTQYTLEINNKQGLKVILNQLRQDKVLSIDHYYALRLYAKFTAIDRNIKAGEYLIHPNTTGLDLINKLVAGKVELHKFTIIEGLRFEQTIQALVNNNVLQHTLIGVGCNEILMAIDRKPTIDNLVTCEGLFMPDTYLFPKGTKDIVILQRAYDAMQNRLNYLWEHSPKGVLRSSYEGLIMASIIEKETSLIQEMKRVSGVYHRRLQIGIPLQADPTVIYGLKIYDRLLTRNDLRKPSVYNTYLNKGLPPSPIATPSVAAVFAALNPANEEYLYFVADGSGGHVFSNSLFEHNNAIATIKRNKLQTSQQNLIADGS